MELLIRSLQHVVPDSFQLDQRIREVLEEGRESFKSLGSKNNDANKSNTANSKEGQQQIVEMSTGEVFVFWWKIVMCTLLCAFFVSCISQFAQYYQMTLDQSDSNRLRKRLPSNVRMELASPTSGRLKLPPPTPSTKAKVPSRDVYITAAGTTNASINKEAQPKLEPIPSSGRSADQLTVPDSKKRE